MPLYADMYYSYLGSSPSVSNPYSVTLPSSHYGSTPISRLSSLGTSSYTRTAHNFYPPSALTSISSYSTSRYIPKLTTISESLGQSRLNRAHHRIRRASPRPITINTSDIDVSASKYRNRPRPSQDETTTIQAPEIASQLAQGGDIGERQMRGTISRNRKVIRLNTVRKAKSRSQSKERHSSDRSSSKKKKEEDDEKVEAKPESKDKKCPPPVTIDQVTPVKQEDAPKSPKSPASWREKIPAELLTPPKRSQPEKSPGEIFMEKFIIRNPPSVTSAPPVLTKSPEKDEPVSFVYPPTITLPTNKGRRTSITLQGLEQLPTFSDICQDISSDKIDDDLNAGALRKRASLILDEELQIFNNLRKGSQSTVTCVLEKELDSDEEIDSEGNKLKKPKQKLAAKVDITNASMNDIKEFVESIKDEIEDTGDKKPKINVVLEAVEEISMIPVKFPVKRKQKPKTGNDEVKDVKSETGTAETGVKMRKKSVMRKSVKGNRETEEKRKSDVDFWGTLDRSETQEFKIRAAKVWERFERRDSQEWVIDIGEAPATDGVPALKSITKEPETEKGKTEKKLTSSKSAGDLEDGKQEKIVSDLGKSKTMSDLKKDEPKLEGQKESEPLKKKGFSKVKDESTLKKTITPSKVLPNQTTSEATIQSKPETNYTGALMKDSVNKNLELKPDSSPKIKEETSKDPKKDTSKKILDNRNLDEPSKDLKQSKSAVITQKPNSETASLEKSQSLSDAKLSESTARIDAKSSKDKHPLSLLKQRLQLQKTRNDQPSQVQKTTNEKPTPKRAVSCEKYDEPVEIKSMVVPAKYKVVTDLVKIDTQNATKGVMLVAEVPKVVEEPKVLRIDEGADAEKTMKDRPKFGLGLNKVKSVKDISVFDDDKKELKVTTTAVKKTTKDDSGLGKAKVSLRTKTQPLEKLLGDDSEMNEIKTKVQKSGIVNVAVINGPKSKPAEKDVHNNKLAEKLQTRPVTTSDVHQKKLTTTTTSNAMKNKICDGGSGEQTIKIEIGKKAKSPETGSRSVDTDTRSDNHAHAIIISDVVAVDNLSTNQSVLLGDVKRKIVTTPTLTATAATVKSQMKKQLNDNNAQDNKSSVVGAASTTDTEVVMNKSSAALRKDTHFDKGKAVAMTNVKDADTTQFVASTTTQQQTTGSDVVEACTDENLATVNNNNKVGICNVDESIVISASDNNIIENDENKKEEVCDGNKDIDTILENNAAATTQELTNTSDNNTQNALAKFPTYNNLSDLTVENGQLNDQLDNTCTTDTNLKEVEEDNCTLRSSKEAGKPIPIEEDEEQDLQKEPQVNKIESSDSNTEETSFSTDCSATEDWSSEESADEEEKQRLKARENLLLLLRMARNDDTPVAKPAPQKKMLLDLDKMKKCYAKEEKAVITLVAKPKPLWKYVRRNKPHKRRNRKLLEKAQELERLEGGETSEHGEPTAATTHSDDSQASDVNSSTKNSKSSASSDYNEYYDFSFPYYVKDEDNNLLVNSRLSQRSIDSGIGGGSSETSSSLKDPAGKFLISLLLKILLL